MNLYIWSGFFSFVCNLIIGVYVFSQNPTEKINRLFLLFSIGVGGWSIGSFFVNILEGGLGLQMLRFNYLFGIWLPPVYLAFIHEVLKRREEQKIIVYIGYSISTFLSIFVFTPWFIQGVRILEDSFFRISAPGIFYYLFFAFFSLMMLEIIRQNWQGIRESEGSEKVRRKWLLLANSLAILAGFEYFSRVFAILKSSPLDDYILVIYTFVLAYAIRRYRLLDIDEVLAFHREKLMLTGLLAASINHEIRNPLFLIQEMTRKAKEASSTGGSLAEINKTLIGVEVQLGRLNTLVERLRDFSKPAPVTDQNELIHIPKVIDDALFFVQQELRHQNIELKIDIPEDLPPIQANKGQLEEIFLNLFMNALQAMPKGGRLEVRCQVTGSRDRKRVMPEQNTSVIPARFKRGSAFEDSRLKHSGMTPNTKNRSAMSEVRCTITDTGTGIPKDELKHIFTPFYTKKEKEGTGLGLYIVKSLVEQNGGRISVESQAGKGTAFKLSF